MSTVVSNKRPSCRIKCFVALSMLAHGIILTPGLLIEHHSRQPVGQTFIQSQLIIDSGTEKNRSRQTTKKKQQLATEKNKQVSTATAVEPGRKTASAENPDSLRSRQQFLLGKIQSLLDRYLQYPHIARLRGWEGKVVLKLHVEANGQLNNISIYRSSGYTVLDDTAVAAINRLNKDIRHISWLRGYTTDLLLPVIYKLDRG